MCLICGNSIECFGAVYFCNNNCGYSVHEKCLTVLYKALNKVIPHIEEFMCSKITHHIKPDEVTECAENDPVKMKALRAVLLHRGKINTRSYNNKRKRWMNDEIECEFCGQWYGANETNHLSSFCTGMNDLGLTEETKQYPFCQLKRFKHITWKVP